MANVQAAASSILFDPLHDELNVSALTTFTNIVKTCIGPYGKLKVIQNVSGGHVTVTSSSSRLFHNLPIKNNLLKFIVSSANAQLKQFGDGGLCCALFILKLIESSSSTIYSLPLFGKLHKYFGEIFLEYLQSEENACVSKLDLSNTSALQSVVRGILLSKPGCILTDADKYHLCLLLLKAFLNIVPCSSSEGRFYLNLNFVTLESVCAQESKLFKGLLIKSSEINERIAQCLKRTHCLKIVLFTVSLSDDAEFPVGTVETNMNISLLESVLKFFQSIIAKVIDAGANIFACQKVVHPTLRKQLEDANILVLERLGGETARHLEFVLGVPAFSSFVSEISYGFISTLKEEIIGKQKYLLISSEKRPFWTLLICNYNEEALNETKVVCQQAIDSLFHLLRKPRVCFGSGCSEIYTRKLVEKKVKESLNEIQRELECSSFQVLEALQIFLRSIAEVSVAFHQDRILNFVSETNYNHLWKLHNGNFPTENDKCMCGQYMAKSVDISAWYFLNEHLNDVLDIPVIKLKENSDEIEKSVILDELSHKLNAYMIAFETASMLLRVSLCVTNIA